MAHHIPVRTEQYKWSHGHKPRSRGLGMWALASDNPWALRGIGNVLMLAGQCREAVRYLEQAQRLHPRYARTGQDLTRLRRGLAGAPDPDQGPYPVRCREGPL
jgi:hypothetical protein